MLKTDPGVHIALATSEDEDIPTHIIVKVVDEDGRAMRFPMTPSETRGFCASLLEAADGIDRAWDTA